MKGRNIKEILKIIIDKLENKKIIWRIEGSANLIIQGVETSVSDLDITTNDEGIEIFKETLKDFIEKDFFNEKINGKSLICDINGFEVEVNSYGDKEKDFFSEIRTIEWNTLEVPILPLKYALEFYKLINRDEKVKLIQSYLAVHS